MPDQPSSITLTSESPDRDTVFTGGPAFPGGFACDPANPESLFWPAQYGMSLRDYFAAKVMQSIFAGEGARMVAYRDGRYNETNWAQVVAMNAYEMADAMLAQRQKGGAA